MHVVVVLDAQSRTYIVLIWESVEVWLSDVFLVTLDLRFVLLWLSSSFFFISSSATKHYLPTMQAPYAPLDLNEPYHTTSTNTRSGLDGSPAAPIWISDDEGATTDDDVEQEVNATTVHRPSTPSLEKPSRAVVRCPSTQSEKKMKNGRFIVRWRPGGGWSAE
jgi:hypothetical protein